MKQNNLLKKYIFLSELDNQFSYNIDFSKTSIKELAEKSKQSEYTVRNANLENYIFQFYAYNEILASYREKNNGIINKEDLDIYNSYQELVNDFSKRIFSFILYACVSEACHSEYFNIHDDFGKYFDDDKFDSPYEKELWEAVVEEDFKNKESKNYIDFLKKIKSIENKSEVQLLKNFKNFVLKKDGTYIKIPKDFEKSFKFKFKENRVSEIEKIYKKELNSYESFKNLNKNSFKSVINFLINLKGENEDVDGGAFQKKLIKEKAIENSKISDLEIKDVLQSLSSFFLSGFDSGYGGEPWAEIAKHALSFAKGEMNAEMFIDRALSLEHNNGQMFNKNFIFDEVEEVPIYFINGKYAKDVNIANVRELKSKVLLHLQNSSSVLSLLNFEQIDIKELNLKSESEKMQRLCNANIASLQNCIKDVDKDKIKGIIKKINLPIPEFNFNNLLLIMSEKNAVISQYHYDKEILENLDRNEKFSNIINSYIKNKKNEPKENIIKKDVNLSINLHDLSLLSSKTLTKEEIGGKAKGLNELINMGFNVPRAMVFDTNTCISYLNNNNFFKKEYNKEQQKIDNFLINENKEPILISIRSGASISMPGMMDTILNVGIDDKTYPILIEKYSKKMIDECAISFMNQFCSSKFNLEVKFPKNIEKALDKFAEILIKKDITCSRRNLFPLSKEQQIKYCVENVFNSWNSDRAIAWRNEKNISHDMGTATILQEMVFGNKNKDSFTAVIFSRNCINGNIEIMGEYLENAQGEDLVSGKRTPKKIEELKNQNPRLFKEIEYIAKTLEIEKKYIQDIELTVEDGKVYVLQMRNAVVSPEAQIKIAKEFNTNLLDAINVKNLISEIKVKTEIEPSFVGLAASPGIISGIVVKNESDILKYKTLNKPLLFFSKQALPEHAPIMIKTDAFITQEGGSTSHAAILARSMEKPCIVNIGKKEINSGELITLDAINGKIWLGEMEIIKEEKQAIELSQEIVEKNKIDLNNIKEEKFKLKSWITDLSVIKILENSKTTNLKNFLSLAQKTAIALKLEHDKQKIKKVNI